MRINLKANGTNSERHPDSTTNYEGGLAFNLSLEKDLYLRVASCLFGEPKFYTDGNPDELLEILRNTLIVNPEYVLKLAVHTRNTLNLRTVSAVILAEASLIPESKPYVQKYAPYIIKRVDELTDVVAWVQHMIGNIGNHSKKGSLPAGLKKGLADCFANFNEYQFGKYKATNKSVKLKDVVRLVHPKPADDNRSALYKRILTDTLEIPDTWETYISKNGSTKENWEYIIPKMGYMAILRNLRNFLDYDVNLDPVIKILTNQEAIKKSKQFPFRFFSAYREIDEHDNIHTSKVLDALEVAMDISVQNLPTLAGTTAIFADVSSSMVSPLSSKSKVRCVDISKMFLSIAHQICNMPITMTFAGNVYPVNLLKRNGVISNMKSISFTGGQTDGWKTVRYLRDNNTKVDRIILLSDMQCYGESSVAKELELYRHVINPDVYFYPIDLTGYGTSQVPENDPKTCLIGGWSEKVFDFIPLYESNIMDAVEKIKSYELPKVSRKEGSQERKE